MKNSVWTLVLGLLMAVAGVLSLLHPFPASLTVEIFVGWSFVILGGLQLLGAFQNAHGSNRLWLLLFAAVTLWIGIAMLDHPLQGLIALTMLIAISLVVSGVAKVLIGWPIRSVGLGGWVILSGVVSALLGVMVMANLLPSALTLLGVLLGIELIFDGVAIISLWHAHKSI
jgi:uncharacterized membrane protein HdeD (DUF308 family)